MGKAITTHTMRAPSRRNSLGTATKTGSAKAAASTTSSAQDAKILQLQVDFSEVVAALNLTYTMESPHKLAGKLYDRLGAILKRVGSTRATTVDGFRAKAAIIAENEAEFCTDGIEESPAATAVRQSLLADLMFAPGAV